MKKQSLAERKKSKNIEAIMHIALHYFEKNGYDNTTIEQLCDEAMISQSTFFNYFGTKEKVVELIMLDGLKDYEEYSEKVRKEMDDPIEAVRSAMMFICDATAKYCNTVSVFHRIAMQREEFRRIEADHYAMGASLIESAFEQSGRTCPLSNESLKIIMGGCYTNPFLTYSPEVAAERIRTTVTEFLDYLFIWKA